MAYLAGASSQKVPHPSTPTALLPQPLSAHAALPQCHSSTRPLAHPNAGHSSSRVFTIPASSFASRACPSVIFALHSLGPRPHPRSSAQYCMCKVLTMPDGDPHFPSFPHVRNDPAASSTLVTHEGAKDWVQTRYKSLTKIKQSELVAH